MNTKSAQKVVEEKLSGFPPPSRNWVRGKVVFEFDVYDAQITGIQLIIKLSPRLPDILDAYLRNRELVKDTFFLSELFHDSDTSERLENTLGRYATEKGFDLSIPETFAGLGYFTTNTLMPEAVIYRNQEMREIYKGIRSELAKLSDILYGNLRIKYDELLKYKPH